MSDARAAVCWRELRGGGGVRVVLGARAGGSGGRGIQGDGSKGAEFGEAAVAAWEPESARVRDSHLEARMARAVVQGSHTHTDLRTGMGHTAG